MSRLRVSEFPTIPLRSAGMALALALLLLPSPLFAGEQPKLGILGDVRVEVGEVYPDDVVCVGGNAIIEGKVKGDVVVFGGSLDFSGEAREVVVIGGNATLTSDSVVHGNLVHVMGTMKREPGSVVHGQAIDVGTHLPPLVQRLLSRGFLGIIVVLRVVSLVISLLAILLIVLIVPQRVERMSEVLEPRWPASLGFGILGYLVFTVLAVVLAITLIGIPLVLLMGIAVWIMGLMGIAAIMTFLGKGVGLGTGLIGPDPSVFSRAIVGFVVVALVRFIPVVGEFAWLVLSIIGFGLVLITKAGSPSSSEAVS